jgi:uncharacterized protein YjiS (DUF1127 family)
MARVIYLPLDAGPVGPALVRIGAHARVLAQFLSTAVAALHRQFASPELQRLDHRLLRDLGLHREGHADWRHLDALTPRERGPIVWPRY